MRYSKISLVLGCISSIVLFVLLRYFRSDIHVVYTSMISIVFGLLVLLFVDAGILHKGFRNGEE